jgi:hypothetical protein
MLTQVLSAQDCHKRWGILGLFSAPLLGSVPYSQGYKLPFLACPILHLTGVPCPTCGMTRSFTAIAQGRWEQAVSFHLFGPILFLLFSGIVVHLSVELTTQHRWTTFYTRLINRRDFQILSITAYLGYYFARLFVVGYPDDF